MMERILEALARLEAQGGVTQENVKLIRADLKEHRLRINSLEGTRSWQKGAARVACAAGAAITAAAGWFIAKS